MKIWNFKSFFNIKAKKIEINIPIDDFNFTYDENILIISSEKVFYLYNKENNALTQLTEGIVLFLFIKNEKNIGDIIFAENDLVLLENIKSKQKTQLFDIKFIFDAFYDKKNKLLEIISKVEILFYDFNLPIFFDVFN